MRFDPTPNQARQDLCDLLQTVGITAHNGTPPQIVPPCVITGPGNPYLTPATFGQWTIRHKLVVVAAHGTNDAQGEALDATLIEVLSALDAAGHEPLAVTEPGRLDTGHLAVDITLDTYTDVVRPDDPVTHYVSPEV